VSHRLAVLAGLALGCTSTGVSAPEPVVSIDVVSGDTQIGSAGYVLAESIAVRVLDAGGRPVAGAIVSWGAEDRQAEVMPLAPATDAEGIARARWRLGRDDGVQHATATFGALTAARFAAGAVSGDVLQASGQRSGQCGRFGDDIVRCWPSPDAGPAVAVPLDSDIRFASLGYALGTWCGGIRGGGVACFDAVDLSPGGQFRPDAAPVRVLASSAPEFVRVLGAGDRELGTTWCGLATTSQVWCWGTNDVGQIGNGVVGGVQETPALVGTAFEASQVAVTIGAACALDFEGVAWCWGGVADRVVDGNDNVAAPTAVPTALRFSQLVANGAGTVCALSGVQTYCWGSNADGARGRGALAASSTPVSVAGTELYVSLGAVAEGFLAVTADRDLVAWGGFASIGFDGAPLRVLPGYVFRDVLPGGGSEVLCLRAYPVGTRCLDRLAVAAALNGPIGRSLIHGVPGG
jgi:hypothetical protein